MRIIDIDSFAFCAMVCVSLMMSVVRNVSFLVFITFCVFNRWSHLEVLVLNAPSYRCNFAVIFYSSEAIFRLGISSHQMLHIFLYVLGTERKKMFFILVRISQYSRFQCSLPMFPTDF